MTTLKKGAKGQDVLRAQCALAAAGVYSDDIDGSFGPHMEAAVSAYQTEKKLPATGVIDAATAEALGLQDVPPVTCQVAAVTPELIAPMFPGTPLENITANLPYLLNALVEAGLCDKQMVLMALATIRAETASFLPVSEGQCSANTTPGGHPFDMYDNREKLGNRGAPDGANFRGRGFIQLTGRSNYQIHGQAIGKDLTTNFMLAHDQETAARLLASFLKREEKSIRDALAAGNLTEARTLVNGGSYGLPQFEEAYKTGSTLIPENVSATTASA